MDSRIKGRRWIPLGLLLAAGLLWTGAGRAEDKANGTLRIGTAGSLAEGTSGGDEKGAIETLRKFIRSETGFENQINQVKGWEELAKNLAADKVQVAVFQGYEFAWASATQPKMHVLALASTGGKDPYRYSYVISRKDAKAKAFAELKGESLTIPKAAQGYQKIFLEALARKADTPMKSFFSKITFADNAEDAIDDLVDGKFQAACVDRAALESYKRRKPGRFNQLKLIAKSEKMPPTVIVVYDTKLPEATQQRFTSGLLNADQKERGRTLLSYFKLTGFVKPPADFEEVLAASRKEYPAHLRAAAAK